MNYQRTGKGEKSPDHPIGKKKERLVGILQGIEGCIVAFSGGLDSSFVATMAKKHVPGRVLCVTIQDESVPKHDLENARVLADIMGLEHLIIEQKIPAVVLENSADRCYHCKKNIFCLLNEVAEGEGIQVIIDGENSSDSSDVRPGRRAAKEHSILSPLAIVDISKEEVRIMALEEGIPEPERPPSACLSSRIPFGIPIDAQMLGRVDEAEMFLKSKGMVMVRTRVEGDGLRIELARGEMTSRNLDILMDLHPFLIELGCSWIGLDMGGYIPAGRRKNNDKR